MSAQPQDPADFAIAADALALARRRIGLDPIAAGPDWTACPAPRVGAVVDADGSVRACEYGSAPLGSLVDHAVAEVREGAAFAKLRSALAGGRLPASHCESCVWPCASGFVADAPMVRDYGALAVYPSGAGLQGLVFRLPVPGAPWSAAARRALTMESKGLSSITLEGVEPLVAANWRDAVAALRSSPNVPPISLRLFRIGDAAQAALALDGLSVADIEIDLSHGEIAELEAARRLAHSLGAPLRARFVLTPAKWFHFEAVAHACSSSPATPLALGIQGRSSEIPLSRLSIEDLGIVRAAINSCWDRFSGTARPVAIDDGAFERLNRHVLALLQSRAEAAAIDGEEGAGLAALSFPPLDHEWFADPVRRTWWLGLLFGQGHAAAVRRWVLWMLENGDADVLLRSHAPFRVLCHRVAFDCRCETAMAALRKTYADAKPRSALCKQDASFADGFDLTPYGGPWAQRLGLVASKPRKAPFVVGKAKAAPKKGEPDVTILIPSYRHSAFIVDAIRSVLARSTNNLFAHLGMEAYAAQVDKAQKGISGATFSAGMLDAMRGFFSHNRLLLETSNRIVAEITDMMAAMYQRFSEDFKLNLSMPRAFSMTRYITELDRVEDSFNRRFGALSLITQYERTLTKRFFDVVATRIQKAFEIANRDTEGWLRAVMNPLEGQIKERQLALKKRLESLKRIHAAADTLEERIDELAENERMITAQVVALENLRLEIEAMLSQDMIEPEAERSGFDVSL